MRIKNSGDYSYRTESKCYNHGQFNNRINTIKRWKGDGKKCENADALIFHSRVNKYCLKWKQVIIYTTHNFLKQLL